MPPDSFETMMRVTWADTDAAQVVHFSRFFVFVERAEEEFYRSLGFSFNDLRRRGFWLPRVEAFCQYRKPARFDDLLRVELTVDELKEKSLKLGFNVTKSETAELLATGYLVIVTADRDTGKAVRIPEEIIDKLKPFSKQIL
jgi:acyl-CoA thioester hydrolase